MTLAPSYTWNDLWSSWHATKSFLTGEQLADSQLSALNSLLASSLTEESLEDATTYLLLLQGIALGKGLLRLDQVIEFNKKREPFLPHVDDLVRVIGEKDGTLFRVCKVSEGAKENTGLVWLATLDGTAYGWEDAARTQIVSRSSEEVERDRRRRADSIRREADLLWERGDKTRASQLHDKAQRILEGRK